MRNNFTLGTLPFVVDPRSIVRNGGRQIDWQNVPESYRTGAKATVVVGTGGAAQGATSVPITPLTINMPVGTLLDFGGNKFARLSQPYTAGGATLTVAALVTALVAADQALYANTGKKFLPAGTRVGDLLGNGKVSPRIVTTNPAIGVLESNATEEDDSASLTGYPIIIGGALYENLLPGASGTPKVIPTAEKTELASAGTGFSWQQYADSRS